MAQPPARPELSQIPPREYIFVIDVSGSMRSRILAAGLPPHVSKGLMKNLLGQNFFLLAPQRTALTSCSSPIG